MSVHEDLLNNGENNCSFTEDEVDIMCSKDGDDALRSSYAPDTTEEVTESQFGVNSIKTLDSVQKSSEIRNFCTEILLFAYLAKIKHFYKTKSPAFGFFSPILAF